MKVIYLRSFFKDVKKLKDPKIAMSIEKIIGDLKSADSFDNLSNIKKMKGYSIAYRIRTGNYRLGIYKETESVELARFLKREDIYKVFPKKGKLKL